MTDKKTRPYYDSEDDASKKTTAYGNKTGNTQGYENEAGTADRTVGYESKEAGLMDKTVAHNLGIGDVVELNDQEYEIADIISGEDQTGEAVFCSFKPNHYQKT